MSQSSRGMDPKSVQGHLARTSPFVNLNTLLGLELPFQWHVTAGFPSLFRSQAQIIFHWFSIMVLSSCQFTPVIGPAGSLQRMLLCACLEAQGTCDRQACSQACCRSHPFDSTGASVCTSWKPPISVFVTDVASILCAWELKLSYIGISFFPPSDRRQALTRAQGSGSRHLSLC